MNIPKKSRKQEILDAALACFTKHGIEATTIDMIRERAKASVGSMYHHFGSKERIAAAVFMEALADYHAWQQARLQKAKSAEDGVKAIVLAYVDWIAAHPDKARFILYNRGALAKTEAAEALKANSRTTLNEVLRWFEPHIGKGDLRKLPLELYGSLITGPAHDYARLWLSGRVQTDIREYREIFAEAAWKAVRP